MDELSVATDIYPPFGYMMRKAGFRDSWLKRWCEFDDGKLCMKDTEGAAGRSKGVIDLRECTSVGPSTAPTATSHELEIVTDAQTFYAGPLRLTSHF